MTRGGEVCYNFSAHYTIVIGVSPSGKAHGLSERLREKIDKCPWTKTLLLDDTASYRTFWGVAKW